MRFINGMLSMFLFALIMIAYETGVGAPFSDEFRVLGLMIGASAGIVSGK